MRTRIHHRDRPDGLARPDQQDRPRDPRLLLRLGGVGECNGDFRRSAGRRPGGA